MIRAEVIRRFLNHGWPARLLQVELIQGGDHVGDLTGPKPIQLLLNPGLGGGSLFAVHGVSDGPEMLGGMRQVDDLRDTGEVQVRDALDPQRTIVDRTALGTMVQAAPQPFRILMQGHGVGIPQARLVAVTARLDRGSPSRRLGWADA